jgi:predicted PurR-regulated permease PerM
LKAASPIIVLVLISAFFSMLAGPAVLWLERKRVPVAAAVALVIVAFLAVASLTGAVVGASINDFIRAVPAYRAKLDLERAELFAWLRNRGVRLPEIEWLNIIEPGAVIGFAGQLFAALGGLVGNALLVLLIVAFILLEIPWFPEKFRAATGSSEAALARAKEILLNVERYVLLKTVLSLATGAGVAIWVALVGLDFALLWGLLAFLLNFIPNIGSVVAAVPALLLSLVQLGPGKTLLVLAGYAAVNFLFGNVLEPRWMGRSLGLSTTVVFLSVLAWGWILGAAGMFLAVPLTVVLRIALASNESTHWLAVLLGPERPARPPAASRPASEADGGTPAAP